MENTDVPQRPDISSHKVRRKGFDIITNSFFVEFYTLDDDDDKICFDTFEEYFLYLSGDIYDMACYYGYSFTKDLIATFNLDLAELQKLPQSFNSSKLDKDAYFNDLLALTDLCISDNCNIYRNTTFNDWLATFLKCDSYVKFKRAFRSFSNNVDMKYRNEYFDYILDHYALTFQSDVSKLYILLEFLEQDSNFYSDEFITRLCLLFDSTLVLDNFCVFGSIKSTTIDNRKRKVKQFIDSYINGKCKVETESYFDPIIQRYCDIVTIYSESDYYPYPRCTLRRTFSDFNEFSSYRQYDLQNCNLSKAISLYFDPKDYKINDTTIFPINSVESLHYTVMKDYDGARFNVVQQWHDADNHLLMTYKYSFSYFFDFLAFLDGDFSSADLCLCDGLVNLKDIHNMNFENAKLSSFVCDALSIEYDPYNYDDMVIPVFDFANEPEDNMLIINNTYRESVAAPIINDMFYKYETSSRLSYVTDLHLMHRIKSNKCKSRIDVMRVIKLAVNTIMSDSNSIVLIGGDVSSDFSIFELFIEELSKANNNVNLKKLFVFVLGNHELWSFQGFDFDHIVDIYSKLLSGYGMVLLQNDLMNIEYDNTCGSVGRYISRKHTIINYDSLNSKTNDEISTLLKYSRLLIFGGIGFAGLNDSFNADYGIYRNIIDRSFEIQQSSIISDLYNKIYPILVKHNTVILTHMPKSDWTSDSDYRDGIVYIHGHTHRNIFHDDGFSRLYADNQVGYAAKTFGMKNLFISNDYDLMADYADGVHEISREQYIGFYRGHNLEITFRRSFSTLYMLKKKGWYCFVINTKKNQLLLLNGGSVTKLENASINYYYDHLDIMVSRIMNPLDTYTAFQKDIAKNVRAIGGSGRIHGCIVDIDATNHIYVNPLDMTVTGYWAADIVYKQIFPSIVSLLKQNCSLLYDNYMKLLSTNPNNNMGDMFDLSVDVNDDSISYLDTDMYKVSREIKKMQKLYNNVLTIWPSDIIQDIKSLDTDI